MYKRLGSLVIFYLISKIYSDALTIQGVIDLGSNWKYKYKTNPAFKQNGRQKHLFKLRSANILDANTTINHSATVKTQNITENITKAKVNVLILLTTIEPKMGIKNNSLNKPKVNLVSNHQSKEKPKDVANELIKEHKKLGDLFVENGLIKEDARVGYEEGFTKTTAAVYEAISYEDIINKPHKISKDDKITYFTDHILKQSLRVFADIKRKSNDFYIKKLVDFLTKRYKHKYQEYRKDMRSADIKTRLGTQKAILDSIDVSNRIMERIVNFVSMDLNKWGFFRTGASAVSVFKREIEKQNTLEKLHACQKFAICRSRDEFSGFLVEILTIVLKCNNEKINQAFDSFTEEMKNTNFGGYLEPENQNKLKHTISTLEKSDQPVLKRAVLLILNNIIANKYKPIYNVNTPKVNHTIAFLEIIEQLDHKITEDKNKQEWNDIRDSYNDWANNKRTDVQVTTRKLIFHVVSNLEKMDDKGKKHHNNNLNIILSRKRYFEYK